MNVLEQQLLIREVRVSYIRLNIRRFSVLRCHLRSRDYNVILRLVVYLNVRVGDVTI